tara:strand:+ start:170 stop:304 length:135 start_codon:yes stop_codon:yes gene_type:complete
MLKIKTKCGLEKKKKLEEKVGLFSKIRLYSFLFFGGIRDFFKEE